MEYITEIVGFIEDNEIEELGTGLDELLMDENGRVVANYLLINHSKTRIYCPSIWRSFRPAVIRYIKANEFTDKDLKKIAAELGIMERTLRKAINEDE